MSIEQKREWWFPALTGDAWIARIREDYPEETQNLSDEEIRDKYADGRKYADLWDHLGDARDDWEKLADAYSNLLEVLKRSRQ
jgi:hypothetical protein